MLMLILTLILIVVLIVSVGSLYLKIQQQDENVSSLKSSVSQVITNIDDVTTLNNIDVAVRALQKNTVPSTSQAVTVPTNPTLSSVVRSSAVTFKLNSTSVFTQYDVAIKPVYQQPYTVTYVDLPLDPQTQQVLVLSNRGTSDITTSPSISSNMVNDVRANVSGDNSTLRLFFTANNASEHDLSVLVFTTLTSN